jgi:hypothetical protein
VLSSERLRLEDALALRSGAVGRRRGSLSLVAVFLSTRASFASEALPAEAAVELSSLVLEWQAPAGCPGRGEVLERVRELVAERGVTRTERLVVRVLVTAGAQDFSASLASEQNGAAGNRVLHADTCVSIAEGVALVIALALTPESPNTEDDAIAPAVEARPVAEPTSSPKATPNRSAEATRVAPKPAPPPTDSRESPVFVLGAALLDLGVIAPAAAGVTVGAGVRFAALELTARAVWLPERRTHVDDQNKGGDFQYLGGDARVCRLFPVSNAVKLAPCAGLELGVVRARPFGTVERKEPDVVLFAPSASGLLRLGVTRGLSLRFDAGAALPLPRPRFTLQNVVVVRHVPPVTGRFGAGLEATIP